MGTEEEWQKAEGVMVEILEELKSENIIPEYDFIPKDAAFYGPKINFRVKCGEKWIQCGTVQLDYFMPKEMEIKYFGNDGKEHYPIMIHRAFLGSYERAILILMEKYQGRFPTWLSPVQARILTEKKQDVLRANKLAEKMYRHGIIAEIDSDEMPKEEKIANAKQEGQMIIPYLLQLRENGNLMVISRDTEGTIIIGEDSFIDKLKRKIEIGEEMR